MAACFIEKGTTYILGWNQSQPNEHLHQHIQQRSNIFTSNPNKTYTQMKEQYRVMGQCLFQVFSMPECLAVATRLKYQTLRKRKKGKY